MFLGLLAFTLGLWLTHTAPAFNLPLAPELIALAVAVGLVGRSNLQGLPTKARLLQVGAALILVHLTIVGVRAGIAGASAWGATCGQMPGHFQQLECAFQAGVDQDFAFRVLSYDVAAAALFLASFVFSFTARAWVVPTVIAVTGTSFAIISLAAKVMGLKALWPTYVLLNSFGSDCMTYLMQNPTWVWPYLFPTLMGLAWLFSLKPKWYWRVPLVAAFLAVCATCLMTQRRGGLLLVFAATVALLMPQIAKLLRKVAGRLGPRFIYALGAVILAGLVIGFLTWGYHAVGELQASLGVGNRFAKASLTDSSRLKIWQAAWLGIKDQPFLGHGYASWFKDYAVYAKQVKGAELLDTAHNYFVQALFELGLLQTLLAFTGLGCLVVSSWRRAPERRHHLAFMGLVAAGYVVIATVQEFNFVRSSYYVHALFAGWLLGAGPWRGFGIRPLPAATAIKPALKWSARGVAVGLLAMAALVALSGSLAGFQYEANVHHGYQPKVRWLRSFGTLSFIRRPRAADGGDVYAVYRVLKSVATSYVWSPAGSDQTESFRFNFAGEKDLAVKARPLFALPDVIRFDRDVTDFGRSISLLVSWPPILTTLPILWQQGMTEWEPGDGPKQVRRCTTDCSLRLRACLDGSPRRLVLQADRLLQGQAAATEVFFSPKEETLPALQTPTKTLNFIDTAAPQVIEIPDGNSLRLSSNANFGLLLVSSHCGSTAL